MQSILGAAGTATIDVCDVERLMAQRDQARAERDRARDLAARLEQIVAKDHELLWRMLDEPTSHAEGERLGFEVATHLNEFAMVSLGGAS